MLNVVSPASIWQSQAKRAFASNGHTVHRNQRVRQTATDDLHGTYVGTPGQSWGRSAVSMAETRCIKSNRRPQV
jgi:hypothetical protein